MPALRSRFATPAGRHDLLVRLGAVVLFVGVYFLLWRPLRVWLAQEALVALLDGAARLWGWPYDIAGVGTAPIVQASGTDGILRSFHFPGGMYFLLPGILLVAYAPRRLYWLAFWTLLMVLGLVSLAAFAVGLTGVEGAFRVQQFVDVYVQRPISLGYPLLVVYGHLYVSPP